MSAVQQQVESFFSRIFGERAVPPSERTLKFWGLSAEDIELAEKKTYPNARRSLSDHGTAQVVCNDSASVR